MNFFSSCPQQEEGEDSERGRLQLSSNYTQSWLKVTISQKRGEEEKKTRGKTIEDQCSYKLKYSFRSNASTGQFGCATDKMVAMFDLSKKEIPMW